MVYPSLHPSGVAHWVLIIYSHKGCNWACKLIDGCIPSYWPIVRRGLMKHDLEKKCKVVSNSTQRHNFECSSSSPPAHGGIISNVQVRRRQHMKAQFQWCKFVSTSTWRHSFDGANLSPPQHMEAQFRWCKFVSTST